MAGERVLVVEDHEGTRGMLRETLEEAGYLVCEAVDAREADEKIDAVEFDAVLSDLFLPRGSGMEVLERVRTASDLAPVILLTAYGTVPQAVEAMKKGAFDFIAKPFDPGHLLALLERALERRRLTVNDLAFRTRDAGLSGSPAIVGESPAFRAVYQSIMRVAMSETTVMLLGESGTGKDLFARALHQLSHRARGPWVAINCAALPRDLVESELFGAEKGAFTGATHRRMGKVELADHGTLFLDEVGELDPRSQAKLLRVLEERCFERLGGTRTVHVDVRVVAASNRDLAAAVAAGDFRQDLFYRLHVFPVVVPPLSARGDDVLLIARHFLARFSREMRRPAPRLSPPVEELLRRHRWPGNVRELRNAIERALILLTEGDDLGTEHFDLGARGIPAGGETLPAEGPEAERWLPLKDASRRAAGDTEARLIRRALEASGGNRTQAARLLGVSTRTLWTKLHAPEAPPDEKLSPP